MKEKRKKTQKNLNFYASAALIMGKVKRVEKFVAFLPLKFFKNKFPQKRIAVF